MTSAVLDRTATAEPDVILVGLLEEITRLVERAAEAGSSDGLAHVSDEALGVLVSGLSGVESRITALRLAVSAEADRRRVAERTAETGTDAWVARLTGSTREQAAGGLWLARLLGEKYPATREAFAAGLVGVDQVRVIVHAAEQAPVEATPAQVAAAERWLVDRATGPGPGRGGGWTRNGCGRPHAGCSLLSTPTWRRGTRRSCWAGRPAPPRPRPI